MYKSPALKGRGNGSRGATFVRRRVATGGLKIRSARLRDNGRTRNDLGARSCPFAVDSGGDLGQCRGRFAATTASLFNKPSGCLLVSVFVVGGSIT
jgi:hypothetical protein